MHPITDVRAGARTRQHLAMFQQLCGSGAMANVLFATSMWDQLQTSDLAKGISREEELRYSPSLLKPMLDNGAQLGRYHNTSSSAIGILTLLVHKPAITLRLQKELIIDRTGILDTAVAKCLFGGMMGEFVAECARVRSILQGGRTRGVERRDLGDEFETRILAVRQDMRRLADTWALEKKVVELMLRCLEESTVHLGSCSPSERLERLSDDLLLHSHVLAMEYKEAMTRIVALAEREDSLGAASTKLAVCGLACILDIVLVVVTGGAVPPVLLGIVRACFQG